MRRVGEFWWGGQKRVWELGWWWNLQWVASLKSQSSLCFCYQIFMWLVSLFYVFAFKKVIWTNNSLCCKRSGKLVLFGFSYAVAMSYIFFMVAANNPLSQCKPTVPLVWVVLYLQVKLITKSFFGGTFGSGSFVASPAN